MTPPGARAMSHHADPFATNHDLGYARGRDLAPWENAAGEALAPPITPGSPATVDPGPDGGLLIPAAR